SIHRSANHQTRSRNPRPRASLSPPGPSLVASSSSLAAPEGGHLESRPIELPRPDLVPAPGQFLNLPPPLLLLLLHLPQLQSPTPERPSPAPLLPPSTNPLSTTRETREARHLPLERLLHLLPPLLQSPRSWPRCCTTLPASGRTSCPLSPANWSRLSRRR